MTNSDNNEPNKSFNGDDLEKLQSDLKNVGSSVHGLFSSLYDISSRRFDKYLNDHKDLLNDSHDFVEESEESLWPSQDFFNYPSVYETRQANGAESERCFGHHHHHPFFRRNWEDHDQFFSRWFRSPFGYAYRGKPSIRAYSDCIDKKGESVYDTKGKWRCLFPNSEIPVEYLNFKEKNFPNAILTKEDFEKSVKESDSADIGKDGVYDFGEKGIFFKKFDDLMDWKHRMRENIRRQSSLRHQVNASKEVSLPKTEVETKPVSQSVEYSYNSRVDLDTNQAELVEVKTEYFGDGTSTVRTVKKCKPAGSKEWINVSEDVENRIDDLDSSKNGWLWNKRN